MNCKPLHAEIKKIKKLPYKRPSISMLVINMEGNLAATSSFITTERNNHTPKVEDWVEDEGPTYRMEF